MIYIGEGLVCENLLHVLVLYACVSVCLQYFAVSCLVIPSAWHGWKGCKILSCPICAKTCPHQSVIDYNTPGRCGWIVCQPGFLSNCRLNISAALARAFSGPNFKFGRLPFVGLEASLPSRKQTDLERQPSGSLWGSDVQAREVRMFQPAWTTPSWNVELA